MSFLLNLINVKKSLAILILIFGWMMGALIFYLSSMMVKR